MYLHLPRFVVLFSAAALVTSGATSAQQSQPAHSATAVKPAGQEVVLDHIREAEDLVESLLDNHHPVVVAEHRQPTPIVGNSAPGTPASTLISVDGGRLAKLSAALDAVAGMVPARAADSQGARGDLRAHVDKAREIVREVLPQQGNQPVRTGGRDQAMVTIDRTALQRLEIEIDAMERVAPRAS